MKTKLLILLALLTLGGSAFAQNGRLRNPTTVPLLYNPGFAGSLDQHRLALANRYNWARFGSSLIIREHTFYASYDQISNLLKGGVGMEAYTFIRPDFHEVRVSGIYAAKISLGSRWTLSPALKFGFSRWRFEGHTIDGNGSQQPLVLGRDGLDFSPGILLNSPNFYIGLSSEYLGSIRLSEFVDGQALSTRMPIYWRFQSGYRFQPEGKRWSLAASGLATAWSSNLELYGQLIFNRDWLLAGVGGFTSSWGLDIDFYTFTFSAGFKHRSFRFLALYQANPISSLGDFKSGAIEFSLMLYLPSKKVEASPESSVF